ncbi:MAG: hypothetical protein IKM54_01215 [Butyricicoccus sp.]|nr:hypothetical protein [Butyricicoccus sp.]
MQKQRTALIAALCTLVLICVFAGTFFFSSLSYQTDRYRVTLPKELETGDELDSNAITELPNQNVELPELSPENVQGVILRLPRLEQYSSTVTNTLYLDEGKTASWRANTYVKNGAQRIEHYGRGEVLPQLQLYYEDRVYAWEHGSTNYWSSAAGTVTADMTAMIPSYRDVCALPVEMITKTDIMYSDGVPCIRVVCEAENTEYTISMVTGLLEQVKYYENGELVREVLIESSEEEPADSLFVLPGKTEPVFAASE